MFNGLLSDRDYWGHQHYLVGDDHPESKRLKLSEASSKGLSIRRANFAKATFNLVDLSIGYFRGCDFSNAQFNYCKLNAAEFYNCNFERAEFNYCEMDLTSFQSSNLENCHLNSDISTAHFGSAYGNNNKFISRTLYDFEGVPLQFAATPHRVYIGCQSWTTPFFGENHRSIISSYPYYMDYYRKYKNEILNLLMSKGWIDEPSLVSKLVNLFPVWA